MSKIIRACLFMADAYCDLDKPSYITGVLSLFSSAKVISSANSAMLTAIRAYIAKDAVLSTSLDGVPILVVLISSLISLCHCQYAECLESAGRVYSVVQTIETEALSSPAAVVKVISFKAVYCSTRALGRHEDLITLTDAALTAFSPVARGPETKTAHTSGPILLQRTQIDVPSSMELYSASALRGMLNQVM